MPLGLLQTAFCCEARRNCDFLISAPTQYKILFVLLADGSEGRIFAGMADILESAPKYHEDPKLIIRKAPHVPVWSVWATLEGTHSEELFEGSTEEEASNWINSAGQVWLEERRRKRNA